MGTPLIQLFKLMLASRVLVNYGMYFLKDSVTGSRLRFLLYETLYRLGDDFEQIYRQLFFLFNVQKRYKYLLFTD